MIPDDLPATACPVARERLPQQRTRGPDRPIRPRRRGDPARRFPLLQPGRSTPAFPASDEGTQRRAGRTPDPAQYRREFALVAAELLPPGGEARSARWRGSWVDDGQAGEFHILVSHYINGMGLPPPDVPVSAQLAPQLNACTATLSPTCRCRRWPLRWISAREAGESPGLVRMVLTCRAETAHLPILPALIAG